MNDLISRQAAIDMKFSHGINENGLLYVSFGEMVNNLKQLPSAQPRKGKWIDMDDFEQCSACTGTHLKAVNTVYGKAIWIKSAYCPNCGADMRGEE